MKNPANLTSLLIPKRRAPGLPEFEALIDLLPEAVLLVDTTNQRILLSNGPATELTAYTRQELGGKNLEELFLDQDDTVSFKEVFWKSLGRARYLDFNLIRHGGAQVEVQVTPWPLGSQTRWILVYLEPVAHREQRRIDEERKSQLWSALIDLVVSSQRDDLEEAIHHALLATQHLTNASILAVYQAAGDQLILQRTSLVGDEELMPRQLSPQDLMALSTPKVWLTGKRTSASLHRVAMTGKLAYLASVPLGHADAAIGLVVAGGNKNTDTEEVLNALQVLATIITIRIQINAVLNNLNLKIGFMASELSANSVIIDAIQDGVMVLTPDLKIHHMNKTAENALGYTSQEVSNQEINKILIGSDSIQPALDAAQGGFPTFNLASVKLFCRNGDFFLANLKTIPVKFGNQLERVVILFQDLSEHEQIRALNRQLENRAYLGEITASFAHEVRNPINNISVGLQLLEACLAPDDSNLENVRLLRQDCQRLDELIKSGLSFVRPMEYKMEPIDLGKLAGNLLERWKHRLIRDHIQPQIQVEGDIPLIEGDSRALEEIITNLMSNAVQAMTADKNRQGGALSLKVRATTHINENDQVEVSVSDTGPGIPEEIRERIFEPFYTTRELGTGLGLAIVKRIVTAHRGSIHVTSVPGATILQVRFPALKKPISEGS